MYNTSKIKYSARVNYDVACPMHFEEYPMDTQRCNISFESWGHPCQVRLLFMNSEKLSLLKPIELLRPKIDTFTSLYLVHTPELASGKKKIQLLHISCAI